MCHIVEEVIAVAFASPKMTSVLCAFFCLVGEVILAEPQDNDLANFKCQVLARQEHSVTWNERQHALVVFR